MNTREAMQVDDAFVLAVMAKVDDANSPIDIIAATLAVAADRGMVVPEGAVNAWGIKDQYGTIHTVRRLKRAADSSRTEGETVVRVAVVEVKE